MSDIKILGEVVGKLRIKDVRCDDVRSINAQYGQIKMD
jgi:hypothetical protein